MCTTLIPNASSPWADYCSVSQIDGFNCLSEKFCVPQEHLCDGFPDCVRATTVFDEMNCIPTPGIATKIHVL